MAGAHKSGAEFLVNTTERGDQRDSDVIGLAGGGFTVLFESPFVTAGNALGAADVYARSYDATYDALADQFQIDVGAGFSENPVGAALGGGFVSVWNAPFGASSSSI